jgi:hypothetical protein
MSSHMYKHMRLGSVSQGIKHVGFVARALSAVQGHEALPDMVY